jgi:DNA-binding SARP family transcriptional activator
MMDIRVLGPLVVAHHGHSAVPSARKPRKVLSLLIFNEGAVVSTNALISEIWEDRPPRSVQTTLQTYVMQIRKQLATVLRISAAEVATKVLLTRNNGYMLVLPEADIDMRRYRFLELAGMRSFEEHDDARAERMFSQALELWRGTVLADVEHGPVLQPEVAGLEQSRLTMIECHIEVKLRRGRYHETLGELASLTAQHTYNENLHAQYMLALYRSGSRGKALETYSRLRESMVDGLGLEPSSRLQKLHHAFLAGATVE